MKNLNLIIFILILSANAFSQTEKAEKDYLNQQISTGKMSPAEMTRKGAAWRDLLSEFGGYPELPYNEKSQEVEFIEVLDFPGRSQAQLHSLSKQWLAISYGNINEVLHYEDVKSGKLISKGFFTLPYESLEWNFFGKSIAEAQEAKCFHTLIFTVKDGRMKIEHRGLEYRFRIPSRTIGSTYYPSEGVEVQLSSLYPVTMGLENSWKSRLRTLQYANEAVEATGQSIRRYIEGEQAYNDF